MLLVVGDVFEPEDGEGGGAVRERGVLAELDDHGGGVALADGEADGAVALGFPGGVAVVLVGFAVFGAGVEFPAGEGGADFHAEVFEVLGDGDGFDDGLDF